MVGGSDPGLRLTAETDPTAARTTLHAEGVLDLQTRTVLLEAGTTALASPSLELLALDLSGVTFMDSTGLGVLVTLNNTAVRGGRRVVLVDPTPRIRQLLELTALDTVLDVEP